MLNDKTNKTSPIGIEEVYLKCYLANKQNLFLNWIQCKISTCIKTVTHIKCVEKITAATCGKSDLGLFCMGSVPVLLRFITWFSYDFCALYFHLFLICPPPTTFQPFETNFMPLFFDNWFWVNFFLVHNVSTVFLCPTHLQPTFQWLDFHNL